MIVFLQRPQYSLLAKCATRTTPYHSNGAFVPEDPSFSSSRAVYWPVDSRLPLRSSFAPSLLLPTNDPLPKSCPTNGTEDSRRSNLLLLSHRSPIYTGRVLSFSGLLKHPAISDKPIADVNLSQAVNMNPHQKNKVDINVCIRLSFPKHNYPGLTCLSGSPSPLMNNDCFACMESSQIRKIFYKTNSR